MVFFSPYLLFSQNAGSVDPSFNSGKSYTGAGPDREVNTTVIQPDGKILVGGAFSSLSGEIRNGIARLNPDGSLDNGFVPETGQPTDGKVATIQTIALQPDGKIIIGGTYLVIGEEENKILARLNADGSQDDTFNPEPGVKPVNKEGGIQSIALQADGKILVGGVFSSPGARSWDNIARLHPDGSFDTVYSGDIRISILRTLVIQQDGKILAGGYYIAGAMQIMRLNSDLTVDSGFKLNTGSFSVLNSIVLQPDGKILIAGGGTRTPNFQEVAIARLNSDGSFDNSFNTERLTNRTIQTLALQPDGKILLGGNGVARLNKDGSFDTSFDVPRDGGSFTSTRVNSISVQSDGKIVIGGDFPFIKEVVKNNLARLHPDGTPEKDFNLSNVGVNGKILDHVVQPDGKILIAGEFSAYDGIRRMRIARLESDGTLDHSFSPGQGPNGPIHKIALQPDGKILVIGFFGGFDGFSRSGIARLNADGSLDESFNPGTFLSSGGFLDISVLPDEKILVAGGIGYEVNRLKMVRLNPNGTLDESFDPGNNLSKHSPDVVTDFLVQPDGKIIAVVFFVNSHDEGEFYHFSITRLNEDGSLDTSFIPSVFGTTPELYVPGTASIALQSDGKILLVGDISRNIIRLNPDGSRDDFSITLGFSPSRLTEIILQPDGKILVLADFTDFGGVTRNGIARFHNDGTLDESFDPGDGPNGPLSGISLQEDGKILLTGDFTSFNQGTALRMVRLLNDIEEPECKTVARAKSDITLKLDAQGRARLTAGMADDGSTSDCGPLEMDVSICDFTCEDLGKHTVDLIVKDASGEISSVPFNVHVVDEIRPGISVPPGIFVWLMRSGDEFRMPDFRSRAKASDNCSLTITQHPRSGTVYKNTDFGYVELEAKDPSGNIAGTRFPFIIFAFNWRMPGLLTREAEEGSGDLLAVPWNTPFEKLIHEVMVPEGGSGREILPLLQWDAGTYNPLTPGLYQVGVHLENRGFEDMDVSLSLPVKVLDKPMPEDILLTNHFLSTNLQRGAVIGKLQTVDAVDREHNYTMADHPDIYLEKGALIWKGEENPPLETTVTVRSTDRAGQTISRDLILLREMPASDDVLVYPNPATSYTHIYVRLAESSEVSLSIYDATGRRVYEEKGLQESSFTRSLDLDGYSSGLYHVIIQINNRHVSKRLIKE